MADTNGVSSVIETLVAKLPKSELHIHIEGSIEADLMIKVRPIPRPGVPPALDTGMPPGKPQGHSGVVERLTVVIHSRIPFLAFQIAERNGLTHLLPFNSLDEALLAYSKYTCLQASRDPRPRRSSSVCCSLEP